MTKMMHSILEFAYKSIIILIGDKGILKEKITKRNRDYYVDMAINYVIEYVNKKEGIE